MVEILGENYISDKEASLRYGYSQKWFIKKRQEKSGPPFVQLLKNGRVLYHLESTDKWFRERIEQI